MPSFSVSYDAAAVIELQKNKREGRPYPSFPQQHGPYGVVKISEGARHTLASM